MNLLTQTNTRMLNLSILLLRLTVGIVLFIIGAGKALGWFGGTGIAATVQAFASFGISAPWVYISIFAEFIGGLLLIVGFLTRPVALALIINMAVATYVTLPMGLFLAAFPFTFLIIAIVILLVGPMRYSVDAWLWVKEKDKEARE